MKPGIGNRESEIGEAPVPAPYFYSRATAERGQGACVRAHMRFFAAVTAATRSSQTCEGVDAPPLFRFPIPDSRLPAV